MHHAQVGGGGGGGGGGVGVGGWVAHRAPKTNRGAMKKCRHPSASCTTSTFTSLKPACMLRPSPTRNTVCGPSVSWISGSSKVSLFFARGHLHKFEEHQGPGFHRCLCSLKGLHSTLSFSKGQIQSFLTAGNDYPRQLLAELVSKRTSPGHDDSQYLTSEVQS